MTVVDTASSSAEEESKVPQPAQRALHPDGLPRGRQDSSLPGSCWLLPVAFFTTCSSLKGFPVCFMKVFHPEMQTHSGSRMGLCTLYPALGQTAHLCATKWGIRVCFPSVHALYSFAMCRPVLVYRQNPPCLIPA